MSAAPPESTALIPISESAIALAGKRPPEPTTTAYGITATGQFYVYGPTSQSPQRLLAVDDSIDFLAILSAQLKTFAGRDYFELRLRAMEPLTLYSLRLPAQGSLTTPGSEPTTQWSVRSLLGALLGVHQELDLRATPGKLCARRGTGKKGGFAANFVDLFWPTGLDGAMERVFADAIGGTRHDLEIALNQLRRALHQPPQFL